MLSKLSFKLCTALTGMALLLPLHAINAFAMCDEFLTANGEGTKALYSVAERSLNADSASELRTAISAHELWSDRGVRLFEIDQESGKAKLVADFRGSVSSVSSEIDALGETAIQIRFKILKNNGPELKNIRATAVKSQGQSSESVVDYDADDGQMRVSLRSAVMLARWPQKWEIRFYP